MSNTLRTHLVYITPARGERDSPCIFCKNHSVHSKPHGPH